MRILVVEDDHSVCEILELFLVKEGYQPTFIHNGKEAYASVLHEKWDLIILDWMLPEMDGITICREIRKSPRESRIPVIMLTARDGESEQVLGLELGADDYVTKPFSPLALMARIKAVLRRYQMLAPAESAQNYASNSVSNPVSNSVSISSPSHTAGLPQATTISSALQRFEVRKETREVLLDGKIIPHLTPKEFDLLHFLTQHPRRVFTREELLEGVWGYDFYGDERTVDVHIKRLRKKIAIANHPWIHTVWGVGYKFDEAEVKDEA